MRAQSNQTRDIVRKKNTRCVRIENKGVEKKKKHAETEELVAWLILFFSSYIAPCSGYRFYYYITGIVKKRFEQFT
jgi:hypothetical protein